VKTLVIGVGEFLGKPFDIRVGWRIPLEDGTPHDIWWGRTRDEESLQSLKEDVGRRYGEFTLVDLR
jgi:hypothetical protein